MRVRGLVSAVTAGHVLAAVVVIAAIALQIWRPLAPDLGAVPDPRAWFSEEYLQLARDYRLPRYVVRLLGLALRLAVPLAVAFTPAGRRLVGRIIARVGGQRPALAAAAVVLVVVVATDVLVLPLAFWAGYVHEGLWGFRTQGLAGWAYDWVVRTAPLWLAAGLAALAGYAIAARLPRAWPPVLGIGGAVLTAVIVLASPMVLEPLEFRTTPLAEGPVRTAVEDALARSDERIDEIVVADASRRTTKQNAYISGLGNTRRVVLYDTLVRARTPEEVGMVFAHELGHQQHDDLPRGTAAAAGAVVITVYLLAWLSRRRVVAGRQERVADPRSAPVVLVAVVLLLVVSTPVENWLSRRAEAAADLAALEFSEDPETYQELKIEITRSNLGEPRPPRAVRLVWGSHPPSAARIVMGELWADGDPRLRGGPR